jgi:hypothetical protein
MAGPGAGSCFALRGVAQAIDDFTPQSDDRQEHGRRVGRCPLRSAVAVADLGRSGARGDRQTRAPRACGRRRRAREPVQSCWPVVV